MKASSALIGIGVAGIVTTLSLGAVPLVFADRVPLNTMVGSYNIGGMSHEDLTSVFQRHGQDIISQTVPVDLKGKTAEYTLGELGVSIDVEKTIQKLQHTNLPWQWTDTQEVQLVLAIDEIELQKAISQKFSTLIKLPQNASLTISSGSLALVPSRQGEKVDSTPLRKELEKRLAEKTGTSSTAPILLTIISGQPEITDSEVIEAQAFGNTLLSQGFQLTFEDKTFDIKPFTIQRLLQFVPREKPQSKTKNVILGVAFDEKELAGYLETTLVPEVDQDAVNAKFEIASEEDQTSLETGARVAQFAQPQRGQKISIPTSVERIQQAIATSKTTTALDVLVTEPDISDTADMERLGIRTLLSRGESDFVGSPKNRVHNVEVGASKYHGLLLAPGEEFSFNKFLGSVDAEGGFKPELVIKQNVTVPEYGGGLCQVSSTVFRAATNAGMKITQRRNHSYAVRYYGTPGFDATIYPGYTDFRFLNNTPGYVLIQTKIVGTKLYFELWGTDDGREIEVVGPRTFDHKPDGSVKATLTQIVRKDGQVLIEDRFYSNYKSPKLFPKAVSENGENNVPTEKVPEQH